MPGQRSTSKRRRQPVIGRTGKPRAPMTWGELFQNLREERGLSRSEVLHKYHIELERSNADYTIRSEAWLARIERGDTRSISRLDMDILFRVVNCSHTERVQLLMYADRSVLTTPDGKPTPELEVLTLAMDRLHTNATACKMIRDLLRDRRASMLNDEELFEIISEVIMFIYPRESSEYRSGDAA